MAVAAKYVTQEVDLDIDYDIEINPPGYTPDPVEGSDDVFMNFTVLKAACLTDEWTVRSRAIIDGINAVCGKAKMSVRTSAGGAFGLLLDKGPCALYEEMTFQYAMGNSTNIKAISSPFVSNKFDPDEKGRPFASLT